MLILVSSHIWPC